MNILILGGAGYLGNIIALAALRRHHVVTVLDTLRYNQGTFLSWSAAFSDSYFFQNIDVRDEAAIKPYVANADAIFPLAAIVGAPACDQDQGEASDINQHSICTLMKLVSKQQRIVFPNTNSGYGTVRDGVCTEETPITPVSLYGTTKAVAEDIVMWHQNATTLRLATVFGVSPRMRLDLLVNDLTYRAVTERKLEIFDGGARRNFIHIGDVAKGFMHCLDRFETAGNIYNLGNDRVNMTKIALADEISKLTGAEVVTGQGSDPDKRDYIVSSGKFYRTGYRPHYDLYFGINELIDYFNRLPTDPELRSSLLRTMTNVRPK